MFVAAVVQSVYGGVGLALATFTYRTAAVPFMARNTDSVVRRIALNGSVVLVFSGSLWHREISEPHEKEPLAGTPDSPKE